jgi:creatinine amidohydrolase
MSAHKAASAHLEITPGKAGALLILWLLGAALHAVVAPRPLIAQPVNTLQIIDMTWTELHAKLSAGFDTVIVPSGGYEQNGPHMIIGKHDHIVRFTAEQIAARLGHTLVAPVITLVPEGDFVPPTGNMLFPGTIGVAPKVFEGVIDGMARSLKNSGFKRIYFIADHGQSQAPQEAAIARLASEWKSQGIIIRALSSYYAAGDLQIARLKALGETDATIGDHAGLLDTSELIAIHPQGVRLDALKIGAPKSSLTKPDPTGASGDPARATPERGRELLELKIQAALADIRRDAR